MPSVLTARTRSICTLSLSESAPVGAADFRIIVDVELIICVPGRQCQRTRSGVSSGSTRVCGDADVLLDFIPVEEALQTPSWLQMTSHVLFDAIGQQDEEQITNSTHGADSEIIHANHVEGGEEQNATTSRLPRTSPGSGAQVNSMNLNTGAVMPMIGLGAGEKNDRTVDAILNAIKIGYRAFDTASMYNTEGLLGEALQLAFKSGLVEREDVFVTTKLSPSDNQPANVLPCLQKSLSNLQLDYVDLYLVHWPFEKIGKGSYKLMTPMQRRELWQAMEACVSAGLAKAIGVSNWSIKKLEELLLHARISPAVNQVEFHPLLQQNSLRAYCESKGILMCAFSPLGAPGNTYGSEDVMSLPIINEIAQKMGKTPAQVILRWILSKKVVPIVRSYTKSRQVGNFDVFGWVLADEDINAIDGIKEKKRILDGRWFANSIDGPLKDVNEIWDE